MKPLITPVCKIKFKQEFLPSLFRHLEDEANKQKELGEISTITVYL